MTQRFGLFHHVGDRPRKDPDEFFTQEDAVAYLRRLGFKVAELDRDGQPGIDLLTRSPNGIVHQFSVEPLPAPATEVQS